MKKIKLFLLLFATISISGQCLAQDDLPYRHFEAFNGDTLQYLEYNYSIRSEQHKDKTVEEILSELEFPVLYVSSINSVCMDCDKPTLLAGLTLCIRQIGNQPSELEDYYMNIRFENPPTFEEYKEASGFSHDNPHPLLSQKLYDFIKDLKVSSVSSNEYILKDPETLKARKESYRIEREKYFEEFKRAGMPEEEIDKIRKRFKD